MNKTMEKNQEILEEDPSTADIAVLGMMGSEPRVPEAWVEAVPEPDKLIRRAYSIASSKQPLRSPPAQARR